VPVEPVEVANTVPVCRRFTAGATVSGPHFPQADDASDGQLPLSDAFQAGSLADTSGKGTRCHQGGVLQNSNGLDRHQSSPSPSR